MLNASSSRILTIHTALAITRDTNQDAKDQPPCLRIPRLHPSDFDWLSRVYFKLLPGKIGNDFYGKFASKYLPHVTGPGRRSTPRAVTAPDTRVSQRPKGHLRAA